MEYKTMIVEKIISNPYDKINPYDIIEIRNKSGIVFLSENSPSPFQLLRKNLLDAIGITLDISIDDKKVLYPIYSKFMCSSAPMKTIDDLNNTLQRLSIYPNPDMDIEVVLDKNNKQIYATISVQKNMYMWASM